jgi:osmoprotectant transport system ATP-binding protein
MLKEGGGPAENAPWSRQVTGDSAGGRAIVFEGVTKTYPGHPHPAVDNVSLEVTRGELVVILGTSGSGKTTLIKMVNRLVEPTRGRIFLDGSEIHSLPVNELRRRIGYVIQQIGLFPHRTVAQNVATVPRLLGWTRERIEERCRELLEMLGLPPGHFAGRYPSQLSGGQQQRVGIARALAADPDLMLMDEPFGALDAITRGKMQRELLSIQERTQKTILFVTHDVEEALILSRRMVIMRRGRVIQYDTPLAIISRPADGFVAELIGTDDILKLMSLVPVEEVMAPPSMEEDEPPFLTSGDSLRTALERMLTSGREILSVKNIEGKPVGQVDLAALLQRTAGTAEE